MDRGAGVLTCWASR